MNRSFRLVRLESGFLLTTAITFFVWVSLLPEDSAAIHWHALWAVLAAGIAQWALERLGFFESYSPLPHRSHILTLLLALPVAGFGAKYLIALAYGIHIARYREIALGAAMVAVAGFVFQYIAGYVFMRLKFHRKIRVLLSERDTEELKRELENQQLTSHFKWVGADVRPDLIVISRATTRNFHEHGDILHSHLKGVPVVDVRSLLAELRGRVSVDTADLWSYLQAASRQDGWEQLYFQIKSVLEPALAAILLVLLSPLILVTAIGVKISSPGPIFFRQRRTGYRGEEFLLVKFRSMRADAEAGGPAWASAQKDKITPFGRFLRKSHLDEIPQLWNILRGEMSFVGPRPERPEYYAILAEKIPLFFLRTLVKPGITGWAQVTGGYAGSVDESREKLEYDLYYMQHMSPRLDAIVTLKTVLIILNGRDHQAE